MGLRSVARMVVTEEHYQAEQRRIERVSALSLAMLVFAIVYLVATSGYRHIDSNQPSDHKAPTTDHTSEPQYECTPICTRKN